MNLSTNFTLKEMIVTNTGLYNRPNEVQVGRLFYLCSFILQPIRDRWGSYLITSGFRSPDVNCKVGGADDSDHLYGICADGIPLKAKIEDVFHWIVFGSLIIFGQAILEKADGKEWIHIGLPRQLKNNQEALIYENGIYKPYK